MKSVWQHFLEAVVFFLIFGIISNILNRINVDFNPLIPAIILLILWTWINMKINKRTKKTEQE